VQDFIDCGLNWFTELFHPCVTDVGEIFDSDATHVGSSENFRIVDGRDCKYTIEAVSGSSWALSGHGGAHTVHDAPQHDFGQRNVRVRHDHAGLIADPALVADPRRGTTGLGAAVLGCKRLSGCAHPLQRSASPLRERPALIDPFPTTLFSNVRVALAQRRLSPTRRSETCRLARRDAFGIVLPRAGTFVQAVSS
jgi:hypothetical protein